MGEGEVVRRSEKSGVNGETPQTFKAFGSENGLSFLDL